jgi:uncharacterized surface protein with fasciclin (FAS1) repeats
MTGSVIIRSKPEVVKQPRLLRRNRVEIRIAYVAGQGASLITSSDRYGHEVLISHFEESNAGQDAASKMGTTPHGESAGGKLAVSGESIANKTKHMKSIRTLSLLLATATCLIGTTATAKDEPQDIVAVASNSDDFKTLVTAIKAADLVSTLQGEGPFTVFAPTDKAFDKLPKGTLEDLLKPENKAKLAAILTYHVVPGKTMAADVKTMICKTVSDKELDVKVTDGGAVTVNDAKVIKTDIKASNGVIHAIDTVLMPK